MFLVANEGVEERELSEPWEAVRRAGGRAELLATRRWRRAVLRAPRSYGHCARRRDHRAWPTPGTTTRWVLPGGVANADQLRSDPHAVHFVRACFDAGKPVGVICHGPWILADAGVLGGRTMTSWPSLKTDLQNAGATWVDEEVRVDGRLVSSRKPDDLPAFCREIVNLFAGGRRAR